MGNIDINTMKLARLLILNIRIQLWILTAKSRFKFIFVAIFKKNI
jgi:hypothetical protein